MVPSAADIAHYDGTNLTVNRRYAFGSTSNRANASDLTSVWAASANDAWFTTNAATLVHYNGASYTETVPAALMGKLGAHLNSVWGSSGSDVWAVGDDGSNSVMLHYNGTAWTQVKDDPLLAGNFTLKSVYAASPTSAFATGADLEAIEIWDGTSWKLDKSLNTLNSPIAALWGASSNKVLAVEQVAGMPSKLWSYNGASWTIDGRISATIYSVGGSSASDIWVGSDKSVYHYDGTNWSAMMALPASADLGTVISVSSSSATDAWAVSNHGDTYHYDGMAWKRINIGVSTDYNPQMYVFSQSSHLTWIAGRGILSIRK